MTQPTPHLSAEVHTLSEAALAAWQRADYGAARASWRTARAVVEGAGITPHPRLVGHIASCDLALGQLAAAEHGYREAQAIAESHAGPADAARAISGLAYCAQHREAWEAAHRRFLEAAARYDEAEAPLEAVRARIDAAGVWYLGGDLRQARQGWEAALPALRAHAEPAEVAHTLANLGGALYAVRQPHEAMAVLDEAAAQLAAAHTVAPVQEARLRMNRGYAALATGDFETASSDLERARVLNAQIGDQAQLAQTYATLSNLRRYQGDLATAIAHHQAVMVLEAEHGVVVEEPGGLLYAAIEDHALDVAVAEAGAAKVAAGGQQQSHAEVGATVLGAIGHRPEVRRRPFVVFAPPCPGVWGPLFPRGATAIASYLNHHGVPTVVVPLSHFVDPFLGEEVARERTRAVIQDAIESLRPRAIGLSITFSFLYPLGLEMARFAREAAGPEVPIIIGGPHVTYYDKPCLEEAPEIDIVVRGEGEWTALELLRALDAGKRADLSEVFGITWRAPDGAVVKNRLRPLGDVLELPEIDFRLLPQAFAKRMEISGVTSRGCSFRCRYCHEFRFWGGAVRQYPPERVVAEMERVAVELGNTMAGIDDSMLSMGEPYFVTLCDLLGKSPHLPESFGFLTRVDTITDEGLEAMKRNRISGLSVGLESGSDVVIKAMNKGVTTEQAIASLTKVRDAGIFLSGFFIVGHPGDNLVESAKTLRFIERLFAERLVSYLDVSMFTPYPGTPFFIHPERHGVEILTLDWTRWRRNNRPICQQKGFSANEIYLTYLRMYEIMGRYRGRTDAAAA